MTSVPPTHGHQGVTLGSALIFVFSCVFRTLTPKLGTVMTSLSLVELHHLSVRITFLHAQTREETDGHSIMRLVRKETAYGITTPRTRSDPWIYRGMPAAQPLYVEPQDMNKQVTVLRWVIRTRILFRTASPCPLLLRRREDPACLTPLFSSKYICANIPVGTYPITCLFLLSLLCLLSSQDAIIHGTVERISRLTPHVRHVAVRGAVYAKSHPFQFFLPSLSHLSLLGRPKDDRAKAEASIARSPWGTAKLQAPYDFRSYSTIRGDQPWRGRSMELTILIRIHIQGVLGLSFSGTASLHSSPRAFGGLTRRARTSQRRCFWLLPFRLLRTKRGITSVVSPPRHHPTLIDS